MNITSYRTNKTIGHKVESVFAQTDDNAIMTGGIILQSVDENKTIHNITLTEKEVERIIAKYNAITDLINQVKNNQ